MQDNSTSDALCTDLTMGVAISTPVSSVEGSASLFFAQPLISGRVFASSAVVIGSELFLLIAQRLFHIESVPVLNVNDGKTIQMPLSELQELLRWMANGSRPSQPDSFDVGLKKPNGMGIQNEITGDRGFPTPQLPETPVILSLYVTAPFSERLYTPSVWIIFPIIVFPGIRGALPLLILQLLAAIFVRGVVPPETTGAKPLLKPNTSLNNPLTMTPNDLLRFLTRFGKHFSSK